MVAGKLAATWLCLGLFALQARSAAPDGKLQIATKERSVCKLMLGARGDRLTFSPDARHVAYPVRQRDTSKWLIVRDGVEGKQFDWYSPNTLRFSPDSSHIGYVVQANDTMRVVIDDQEQPAFAEVRPPVFSKNGKRFAYAARPGKEGICIVLDGKAGKVYQKISFGSLAFSADSAHFAFSAESAGKSFWVIDDKEQPQYDAVGPLVFSADSKRWGYFAQKGSTQFVVIDGKEGPLYGRVGALTFSDDGAHIAYAAQNKRQFVEVIDGKESETFDMVSEPVFSRDGKHFAYVAVMGKLFAVVRDGKLGVKYDKAGDLRFSADGLHLAYHVVLDGRHKVVVDDQEGPDFDTIGEIFISPNGAHVAYGAKRVDQEMVMIDGKEYPGAGNLVMSPAGNYFAHARENLKFPRTSSLWINGTEGPEFEGFLYGCPWVFTSDNTLEFMVGKGTEIIHVEATIQP